MITDAALYLARPEDIAAALAPVAGRPLAFRMIMAAIRAGARRVHVPPAFRGTPVERAVASTSTARAAVAWLRTDTPVPAAVLLVPAAGLVPPAALAPLLNTAPACRLRASRASDAPIATLTWDLAHPLWPAIANGEALGTTVARACGEIAVQDLDTGWYVRVAAPRGADAVERLLEGSLGSVVDTWLDRVFHRKLARPVARLAIACGITPNPVTIASLLIGLAGVGCFWPGSAALAAVGLALYAASVVLDHADGAIARLTFAESPFGEWLDVVVDTVIHSMMVLVMGIAAHRLAGGGAAVFGVIAAAGFVASAAVAKTSPPAGGSGLRGLFQALGNRDGFYAMLVFFILGLAFWPSSLPFLMAVVAVGSHAFWLGGLALRLVGVRRGTVGAESA